MAWSLARFKRFALHFDSTEGHAHDVGPPEMNVTNEVDEDDGKKALSI